jgi:hypothetical protein
MLAGLYAITALLVFDYSSYFMACAKASSYDSPLYLFALGTALAGSFLLGLASLLVLASFRWGVLCGSIGCLLEALWTLSGIAVQIRFLFSRFHVGYDAHYVRAEVAMLVTIISTIWALTRSNIWRW